MLGLLVLATLTAVTWHVSHGASAAMQRAKVRAQQAAAYAVDPAIPDKLSARDQADTWRVVSHAAEHKPKMPPRSPLPVEDTPWKALYAELAPRAAAGERPAADRLWRDTMHCVVYLRVRSAIESFSRALGGDSLEPDQRKNMEESLARVQDIAARYQRLCAGATETEIQDATYPTMLLAAEAGDDNAARCYVEGMQSPGKANLMDPAHQAAFKQHAQVLAREGIARGDWGMVFLLAYAYSDSAGWGVDAALTSYWYRVVDQDPLMWYAYSKLGALGKESAGITAAKAEAELQDIIDRYNLAWPDVAAADAWASETYTRFFSGRPYTGPMPGAPYSVCDAEY